MTDIQRIGDVDINDLADRFLAAIERADIDTVRDMYCDDATIWHNFDDAEQTRDQNVRTMRALHRVLTNLRYEQIRRVVLDDGFVQQHVLRASAVMGDLAIPAMLRVYVRDGRIARVEEYLDPAPFAAVVGG